jgi:hypothetical protein
MCSEQFGTKVHTLAGTMKIYIHHLVRVLTFHLEQKIPANGLQNLRKFYVKLPYR